MSPPFLVPKEERPREKALREGLSSLQEAELLALLLGHGGKGRDVLALSHQILARHGGLHGLMGVAPLALLSEKDVGAGKAMAILASFEIARRLPFLQEEEDPKRRGALLLGEERRERLLLIAYSPRGEYRGHEFLAEGGYRGLLFEPGECFRSVLRLGGRGYVLCHSHPEGASLPSEEDVRATLLLLEEGKRLGLRLLDHIVYGKEGPYSLREAGLIPS